MPSDVRLLLPRSCQTYQNPRRFTRASSEEIASNVSASCSNAPVWDVGFAASPALRPLWPNTRCRPPTGH
jgi:hypothetical protein